MKLIFTVAIFHCVLPIVAHGQESADLGEEQSRRPTQLVFSTGTAFDDPASISWEHVLGGAGVYDRIEMTDDQAAKINEFRSKNSQDLNGALLNAIGKGREPAEKIKADKQRRKELRREFNEQLKEQIQSTLLPHQLEILNEIAFEKALASKKAPEVLVGMFGGKELTSTESASIHGLIEKVQKDLDKEIQELRMNAWKELLSKVEPKQAKVLKHRMRVDK